MHFNPSESFHAGVLYAPFRPYNSYLYRPTYLLSNGPDRATDRLQNPQEDVPLFSSCLTPSQETSPTADPLEGFLNDRLDLARLNLNTFLGLLYQRDQIHAYSFYRINQDQITCQNALFQIESWPPGSSVDRRRSALEGQILALEHEKRVEDTACWRDKAFITRDLMQALRDYRSAQQKQALLADTAPLEDHSSYLPLTYGK